MKDCRSKLTHNGKRKLRLLVSFHIFDSLVGRVLVKLIKCLGKHVSPGKSNQRIWRESRFDEAIAHLDKGKTADQALVLSRKIGLVFGVRLRIMSRETPTHLLVVPPMYWL